MSAPPNVAAPRQRFPYLRENPDFIAAAVNLGTVVLCTICSEVVGIGTSVDDARAMGLRDGTAVLVDGDILCPADAKEWRAS